MTKIWKTPKKTTANKMKNYMIKPPLEENDHGESNRMEEDSTTDDNMLPFPHQTSTSQYQRLVSSKSSGRGKLNIVDYGHDEVVVSSEHEEGELGSNDDLMFGLEHQIANVDFQGKTSPAAVQGTPESPDLNDLHSFCYVIAEENRQIIYLKRSGKSYNAEVCNKKDYRNPDILLHPVQYQDIDQIGSCFGKDVFDPHGYDKTDYYDEIGRHVFPASYERDCMCHARSNTLGIRRHPTEGIRPRASDRGHPTDAIRASYARASEGKRNHARSRRSAWRPMLGSCYALGRPEGMATYGQHCAIHPI
ncbi:Detected protein of confused Function [Hibiscus syriacus]|uniref:Detected protein of confused Function n=1 Tax=Hibiscus syriacus TaxID=106335 RepID=A0A6A3AGW5_HIBSY|nr:Detected protein of confused Function [Hibiscus syriacus]